MSTSVIIIGGGITGLAAAYLAAKEGKTVTVLEASNQFGGLLNTFSIGNNRLEYYYHHFFTHDAELNWLIKELKLEHKLFFSVSSMGVFRKGKVYSFNGLTDLLNFNPINFLDKIRFGFSSIFLGKIAKWENFENISCLRWFYKWAGKSTTTSLWKPLLDIKFGPFAENVPLSWMIGRLRQRMNSRKGGDEKLGYLDGSLQVLLDALLAKLNELNVTLIKDARVQKINFNKLHIQSISTANGEYTGDQFLFTIPSPYLGQLVKYDHPGLSEQLLKIAYFGAVCTILELDRPLSSIYWMNIADDGFPFGGIIEHTNLIPSSKYNGVHIVYLSRYFAMHEPIATISNDEIKNIMIDALPRVYKNFDKSCIRNVHIFKTNTAAPVCDLNFSEKILHCKTSIENFYVANMSHVYPDERSANNSIRVAAEACRVMGINTEDVPKNTSLSGKIGF